MGKVDKNFKYYARIGDNRLMAGLMHIIIRNDMAKDDAVEEYWTHTAGGVSGSPDPLALQSAPFNSSNIDTDPGRTGYGHAIGDYDVFLYFVTVGARLAAAKFAGTALTGTHDGSSTVNTLEQNDFTFVTNKLIGQTLKNTTRATSSTIESNTADDILCDPDLAWANGDNYLIANTPEGNTWYTLAPTHTYCQSFVRYQLLARHNNAYGHDDNNYLHYGMPVYEYGDSTEGAGNQDILIDQALIGGSTRRIVNTSTFSTGFGTDLSTIGNNTYFAPVSGIRIYGNHNLGVDVSSASSGDYFVSGQQHHAIQRHDTTFYNLIVDIDLHGYVNPAAATVAFFRNKTNIFFQPFGESTELQFSKSEFTS